MICPGRKLFEGATERKSSSGWGSATVTRLHVNAFARYTSRVALHGFLEWLITSDGQVDAQSPQPMQVSSFT
jgi:hypothetical protein